MKTKKSFMSRLTICFAVAFIMAILCTVFAIPASAAEIDTAADMAVVAVADEGVAAQMISPVSLGMSFSPVMVAAGAVTTAVGSGSGSKDADSTYTSVINFFVTWIRRIGAVIAFVGAIMFGLSIKNHDGEQKQQGLLTMVAGFVVVAICLAVDMFDLFS